METLRCIVIDPANQTVEELTASEPVDRFLEDTVNGKAVAHPVATDAFPDHYGYVNENGIAQRQDVWWLDFQMVWGPMVLLTESEGVDTPARVPLEEVRARVSFNRPG